MNIGIFGGSFDPIHTGHAIIANYASQWEALDEVWLMVSPQNPLKEDNTLSSEDMRCEMAEIVAKDCANVRVSRFEQKLPKPSYSYRTLSLLREKYPEHTFTLIIGSDNWQEFPRWRANDRIIS
ncbi:MAG: nicotinate-nicotinamide nucleotide adenylyltransferase, partial [Muribaculaceae bacterium]|nr:nicotinate-nicotinamide nucleotide adenylyltransferase [Muribaculaceae bacterium]